MLKSAIQHMIATGLEMLRQRRTFAKFAALYAALLATLYAFAVIREATLVQVLATLLLMLAAPLAFLLLQAAILDNAAFGRIDVRRALRTARKLVAATLPVLIIGAALFVILNQSQSHYPAPVAIPTRSANAASASGQLTHWPTVIFATLRWLLFGFMLPLVVIHSWIETVIQASRMDRKLTRLAITERIRRVLFRSFAPSSVLTYSIGLLVFALVPYALLFTRLPIGGARTDVPVFIARLVLVFLVTLFGWILTVTTLARDVFELQAQMDDEGEALVSLEWQTQSL